MSQAATTPATSFPFLSERHLDPHAYPDGVAFLDGQYLPMSQAKISVLDWGFLHSDATYDTVHVWDGRFFRLNLHLDRFFGGLEKLRMTIPFDRGGVAEILHNCVALSGHRAAYVEMLCTRGASPTFSRDPRQAINRFMAFAVPFGSVANAEQLRSGLHVAISDKVRIPPASIDPSIKNYHWLDLVRGLYDAYDRGADTALILDFNGNVAEGPGFNVFCVKDGKLSTPAAGVLPGITRRTVFDLCAEASLSAVATEVSVASLKEADEVFITSTAGGLMPVTMIDGAPVAAGNVGPITERLMGLYWKRHEDPDWSSAVRYP
ncbi:D-amino acid aminotransferase [Mesorhizobium sp.]|jgi:branched-chain amino acid aminotransferase|uniref:D-amino acid aminotransferase n=1 Tax=Mesorhizobium sp. TaxID=1871066 RepID=UPI000FE3B7D9|nr:D-amino acid aminotransferase [Mesorhizobium sp.]RWH73732.1 MAG: branched-chain amino acid transferase [Mesorhizobium sp.]RWL31141.1 MAG: branched-chain amino acid transferase [Mesorhizobium sp.]RWL36797.1 MAG: branched-chain amino acid transferase [Mesorhizobium sp.]RWL40443.1 MAG: branched-chain amino acid transferase [Mesorhizobium sp.]RWL55366.1 MAG: branched-chain amino acid transferase [Mesorhizobium sp.]